VGLPALKASLRIRALRANDLAAYAKVRHAHWPSRDLAEHRLELTLSLARKELHAFLAELDDGEVVGFAEVKLRAISSEGESKTLPFVEGIWVHEEFRRRELGRFLIEALSRWAKDAGYAEIASECEPANAGAMAAHEAWGFTETKRTVSYRRSL